MLGANGRPGAQRAVDLAFCMSAFGQHAFLHVNMHVVACGMCQLTIFWGSSTVTHVLAALAVSESSAALR